MTLVSLMFSCSLCEQHTWRLCGMGECPWCNLIVRAVARELIRRAVAKLLQEEV